MMERHFQLIDMFFFEEKWMLGWSLPRAAVVQ